jgi:plasmid stabilization system protein ParE
VNRYELSPEALRDLEEILQYTEANKSDSAAYELEGDLIQAMESLAERQGIGHLREEIVPRPYFVYLVEPYLIIHERGTDPLSILRIVHSSRNLRKLLKTLRRKK